MPETIEQKTEYVAPGPGPWFLETTHYPRPLTLYYTQTYSEPYADAWRSTFSRYGSLLDRIECRFSGSFAYIQICPLLPPNPELGRRIEQVRHERESGLRVEPRVLHAPFGEDRRDIPGQADSTPGDESLP